MAIVWKLGRAKVDDVRAQQPRRRRSAYTTVQTVMNRLVERGLLTRERAGKAFLYRPRYEESEYLARSMGRRLANVSPTTRRAALVSLVDGLDVEERDAIVRYANRLRRRQKAG